MGTWSGQARKRYEKRIRSQGKSTPKYEPASVPQNIREERKVVSSVVVGPLIFSPNATSSKRLVINDNRKTGQIEILVPQSHDLSSIFTLKGDGEGELRKLCLAMLTILEAVSDKKIKLNHIPMETLKKIYRRLS